MVCASFRANRSTIMDSSPAFCPGCRKEVVFQQLDRLRICPVCGFQYQQSAPGVLKEPTEPSPLFEILGVLGKTLLFIVAVGVVGIGLLFAGCAILSKMH